MGYHRAGFDVVGVDIAPQPNYPFEFVQADALEVLACLNDPDAPEHYEDWLPATKLIHPFAAIHASPPCQRYSIANNIHGRTDHPDLVGPTRELLQATGLPYVIENVPGAPLIDPVVVCGLSLGLNVKRHRLFETNFPVMAQPCGDHSGDWLLVFGHTVLERSKQIDRNTPSGGPRFRRKHVGTDRGREAMGIDWMNRDELSEAIPPAYTELIGAQLLDHLHARTAA